MGTKLGKAALITGVAGQDSACLSQFLLGKGYELIGMARRSSHSENMIHRLKWLGVEKDIEIVDGN